ncbi:MAG: nucleolar RNA-binding Nop10p family protein [archaeon]
MRMKKCKKCNIYTMKEKCSNCSSKTEIVSHKFIKYQKVANVTAP